MADKYDPSSVKKTYFITEKEEKPKTVESRVVGAVNQGSNKVDTRKPTIKRVANREATRIKLTHAKPRYKK